MWRLIHDEKQSGAFNMAADEYLLREADLGASPVIRLYTWDQPTLSIGKNQKIDADINHTWCKAQQLKIIRRETGGKAVLHGNDITYSIVGRTDIPEFSQGIIATYQAISKSFVLFFEALGLSISIQETSPRAAQSSHVCFTVPSAFEILVNGKKIIGSAQRQTRHRFLQHGTIPIASQTHMLSHIFSEDESTLTNEITSLETEGILESFDIKSIYRILRESFEQAFHTQLEERTWSQEEKAAILRNIDKS